MKKHLTIFIGLILLNVTIFSAQYQQGKDLVVYAVPGQNGLGSEEGYVQQVLGNDLRVVKVGTPSILADLGQSGCQGYLRDALQKEDKPGIVYATSQGTATAINYLASCDKKENIQALVLEAVLASGNSAIHHTLTGTSGVNDASYSYYILPYLARIVFPCYRAAGEQPIKALDNLPKDIPIIIVHSKNDMQLPYDGACALYYGLRSKGNDNVYFISKDGFSHINILYSDPERNVVRSILKKHDLLKTSPEVSDLSEFQPDPLQYKPCYDALMATKEAKHTYVERTAVCVGLLAGSFIGYRKYLKGK